MKLYLSYDSKSFLSKHRAVMVCLFLVVAILAVYWQVQKNEFVSFDDNLYIIENSPVQSGLTLKSIVWSFTTTHAGNWHPLTWLSHMLDIRLFGMNAGGHHLTSLFFHIANTLLLFAVFNKMTGDFWQSGFVAALFALHPLRVESVGWVSERKDVISTFFWMLTMWSYIWYVENQKVNRYFFVILFFTLGLMAKPMLVTLPFVLLLLDYWPLCRFEFRQSGNAVGDSAQKRSGFCLVREKIPLFVLVAAASVVTLMVESVSSLEQYPLNVRVANALVSYVSYIKKTVWPDSLACFYPHPGMLPGWQVAGACLLLVSISFLVIIAAGKRPFYAVGWLWYIGTLVPVIGLVQIGSQAMADRYTYVPLIGIFIIVAWGVPELWPRRYQSKTLLATLAAILLSILMVITWKQIKYWENSITLYEHAIEVTPHNALMHGNLGVELEKEGRLDEAIGHYLEALRIKPDYAGVHNNLGVALANQGRIDEAISHYLTTLRIEPDHVDAHNNLGVALANKGLIDEAIGYYLKALRIKPDHAVAHTNFGVVLEKKGRINEAMEHHLEALRLQPAYAEPHYNLGVALANQDRIDEAIDHYLEALRIKPDYAGAHSNLGVMLTKKGRVDEAVGHYLAALRIKPDYVEAHFNFGNTLVKKGRIDAAIGQYIQTLRIKPDYEKAHTNLGIAFIRKGNIKKAIYHFREALRIKPDDINARDNLKRALMSQKQG